MNNHNKILDEVSQLWESNCNCAQSTAAGMVKTLGYPIEAEVLLNSFKCFGGGFKEGSICGSVSGNLAAISLIGSLQNFTLEKTINLSEAFKKEFSDAFGSLDCTTLLSPFQNNQKDPHTFCTNLVKESSRFASSLLDS